MISEGEKGRKGEGENIHDPLIPPSPLPPFLRIAALVLLLSRSAAMAAGEPDAFALPGVGARQGGMGGAFIGLSDDIESIYYNPAGLGNLIQSGVSAMFQPASLGTSRGFIGGNKRWVHPTLPGSVGAGWLRMSSGDIETTDAQENVTGSDTLTNDLFLISAGVRPFAHWALGASVKYFRFAFQRFNEAGFGFDVGAHGQYHPFRVGVVLTDIGGTKLTGDSIDPAGGTVGDVVPPRLKTGLGVVSSRPFGWPLSLAWDIDATMRLRGAQDTLVATGVELWSFQDRFATRAGYRESGGPTLGFGARFGKLQIDYSFLLSMHLKDEHRVGTTVRF